MSFARHRRQPLSEQLNQNRVGLYQVSTPGSSECLTNYSDTASNNLQKQDIYALTDIMTGRDRTSEFAAAVKMLRGRGGGLVSNGSAHHLAGAMSPLRQRSQFTLAAKQISSDLANTCTKLEKLALLVRKQTLFDDRGEEVEELQYIVKQDLAALAKQVAQLQNLARGGAGGTGQRATHSNTVVSALSSRLQKVSKEFKTVLDSRTETLKKQAARREQFSGAAGSMPQNHMQSPGPSLLLQDEMNAQNGVTADMAGDSNRYQQQLQLIDEQDAYLQSRADSMRSIEQTVVELGSIFQSLSVMVKEQEEMVLRIDSHTEEAAVNVEAAHSELVKYFKSISSNRWLMIKVFGVLVVFFIIFVVFVA